MWNLEPLYLLPVYFTPYLFFVVSYPILICLTILEADV